ncbi:MAG: glycosyltransferase family 4 protein [Bacteroidota bacterium]
MNRKKKIVFLYFELAGYFLACVDRLIEMTDAEVHIVKYPVNSVAPFKFKINPEVKFYDSEKYNREELISLLHSISPDLLYVCGWSNKDYVAAAKSFDKKIPVLLTFDNPWRGTLKQYIATLIGGFYLKRIYTHCWVPGEPNAAYARRLGFKGKQLMQGMYSADVDLFKSYYESLKEKKQQNFPHRFLFAGRYTALKGISELWQAFVELQNEMPNDWELWCLGKGELLDQFPVHEKVKNFGFIQPSEMYYYLENTGVFLLPSHYEHWGVAVHEFAAAGFPMICTNTTSAASAFLKDGVNGFTIEPYSMDAIKEAMKKIIHLNDADLNKMAVNGVALSTVITPTTWSQTIIDLLN